MAKKSKRNKKDIQMDNKLDKLLSDEYGERFGNEKIIQSNIAEAALEYSKLFGANKNLYRTIASLIDGLKPGKRRLFYSWWELENKPTNTRRETLNRLRSIKVDRLSSNTINYHPHGNTAVDDVIGGEGQYWSNNVMTIVPQGSYGNMRGDEPAAGRYREAKLSEYTIDCFFEDFDKYCVPMKLGYDGELYEPEFLPAKYPHILFNPQFSGIGYGLASNIPPFNVSEVLDATISLIKNPKANILLIPDSPTGSDIIDNGTFKEMNLTGRGKVVFRATSEIDYQDNVIRITSLPYNINSKSVIAKIIELINKGTIKDIQEIQDSTKEGEVDIKIKLKPSAKPDLVLKKLYKKGTGLKFTYPCGITVIDDYQEYEYGIKELLLNWIDYRLDIVRSMFLNNLQITLTKQKMNEVLLMVFNKNNIDTTINIAKTSKSRKETIERLMDKFKITSVQAGVIADMKVYNFNEDSYNSYKEDSVKLEEELNTINEILQDDNKLEEFVINQLKEGKKKWGRPRKSKVVKEDDELENIPDINYIVGVTQSGFIKKVPVEDSISIGSIGKGNDGSLFVFNINNAESLLIIDSGGYVSKIAVSSLPDMTYEDTGVELSRFFTVNGTVKAVMELPSPEIFNIQNENLGIIFITKNGLAKRVQLSEFKNITDNKQAIKLTDNDEVGAAIFTLDNNADIIISTFNGNGIKLPLDEIRNYGLSAQGLNMITLQDDDYIVNASLVNKSDKYLLYVTTSGRIKLTEMKYFPTMERRGEPVNLIALTGKESLIGVVGVNKNNKVIVYKKKTDPEVIEVKSLDIDTRVSKGRKLVKTGSGNEIVGFKVFK